MRRDFSTQFFFKTEKQQKLVLLVIFQFIPSREFHILIFKKIMKNIKLFADRMSHPSRFCIQFLKMNDIAYSEQKVDLLKGKHLILDYNDRYR